MNEFELIARYFGSSHHGADVLLGVGDDAAVLDVPAGYKLVAAVDTIVEGIHFPLNSNAGDIAWRALAVNLSDIAAMGAIPKWFTLSLCIPQVDESWLKEFAESLNHLAAQFNVQLVGGDTVKGPLNISVQIMGLVEQDQWLTRSGAKAGDLVYVSGAPGEAAGGLQLLLHPELQISQGEQVHSSYLINRFLKPQPRVELGRLLRPFANACMDVSDGLLGDLRKLCAASECGAMLRLEQLPRSASLAAIFDEDRSEQLMLCGGDDYELLFTVAPSNISQVTQAASSCAVPCTCIGMINQSNELRDVKCFRNNHEVHVSVNGFDHFA
ncbi:MAG TPA: thiamine-phosphate kinase [Steroidobacteraceae bacterium]|nr:thiamine-phosphate kinase [Steroidobacteraceae bacterium]